MASERLLDEDEHPKKLSRRSYRDTEIVAEITGPDVTADEYYERVEVTRLAPDEADVYGRRKLSLPTDPEAIDAFIHLLMGARLALENEIKETDNE